MVDVVGVMWRGGCEGTERCFARGYGGRVRLLELPEFLFADGGDEFLEVEWFEVGDVLEVCCTECCDGGGEEIIPIRRLFLQTFASELYFLNKFLTK